jgi:hypothetical protein
VFGIETFWLIKNEKLSLNEISLLTYKDNLEIQINEEEEARALALSLDRLATQQLLNFKEV